MKKKRDQKRAGRLAAKRRRENKMLADVRQQLQAAVSRALLFLGPRYR